MRLIDVDEVLRLFRKWIPQLELPEDAGDKRGVESCIMILEDTPIVDAVPVVRCKDCKMKHEYSTTRCFCGITGIPIDEDDFCSFGGREDNDR